MDEELQNEINILLEEIANSSIAFIYELLNVNEEYKSEISRLIKQDNRFLVVNTYKETVFIPKKALLKHILEINSRVATLEISFISENQFFSTLASKLQIGSEFLPESKETLATCFEKWALTSVFQQKVFFPLADLLASLTKANKLDLFNIFYEEIGLNPNIDQLAMQAYSYIWLALKNLGFSQRHLSILIKRFGLTGKMLTLEEVGNFFGLTRERIRQIEARFWDKYFKQPASNTKLIFTKAFLCLVVSLKGQRLYKKDDVNYAFVNFLSKALDLGFTKSTSFGFYFLGVQQDKIEQIEQELPNAVIASGQALPAFREIFLPVYEWMKLVDICMQRLKQTEIVYLALKKIGKPAHYTEVTAICNKLFPGKHFTPRNIHAVLSREYNEDLPWVWVGMRGVFALKEWGYKRPELSLYQAVTKIVEDTYSQTKRPVLVSTIYAAINKYRPLVKQSSLLMAINLNPEIIDVGSDSFVPASEAKKWLKYNKNPSINHAIEDLNIKINEFIKEEKI